MRLSGAETLPQLSHCAESCLRCGVLVVLPGAPLIYHGGSRFVPEEAVVDAAVYQPIQNIERDAEQRDGSIRLGGGGLVQVYLVLGGSRRSLDLRIHDVKNEHSQAVVFALW